MNEIIKTFIEEKILRGSLKIDENTSLYKSGLVSSMSHLKLVNFLENKFNVSLSAAAINMDNFDTVSKICEVISNLKK